MGFLLQGGSNSSSGTSKIVLDIPAVLLPAKEGDRAQSLPGDTSGGELSTWEEDEEALRMLAEL